MHPVFNPVAPYRYLFPNLYLSVADIANPDLFVCGSRTWISLDITHFYEAHCQSSSGSAWPAMARGGVGGVEGERIGFGLCQSWRIMWKVGYVSVF